MTQRKCGTCRHFEEGGVAASGWCRHPLRRDIQNMVLVRKTELACRNGWDHDLWEPRETPAEVSAPRLPLDESPVPDEPRPSGTDEVAAISVTPRARGERPQAPGPEPARPAPAVPDARDRVREEAARRRDEIRREVISKSRPPEPRRAPALPPQPPVPGESDDDVVRRRSPNIAAKPSVPPPPSVAGFVPKPEPPVPTSARGAPSSASKPPEAAPRSAGWARPRMEPLATPHASSPERRGGEVWPPARSGSTAPFDLVQSSPPAEPSFGAGKSVAEPSGAVPPHPPHHQPEPEPAEEELDSTSALAVPGAASLPQCCATCRDFRPAEGGQRGWCNNHYAFDHRRMVQADELACQSSIGTWWVPSDDWWLQRADISHHGRPTPIVDEYLHRLLVERGAPQRKVARS